MKDDKMNTELLASIELLIPNGNRLELPEEQISNYAAVKKTLLAAGGKYKRNGFDFTEDAAAIQNRLLGGEAIDDVKKYQYYPTPELMASTMIEMAGIEYGDFVLEPSAGQGAIADLLPNTGKVHTLVELMPQNIEVLKRKGYAPKEGDFLEMNHCLLGKFDKIIANPPFTKGQDIAHVTHMYELLAPGGKLVSVMSPSWLTGTQKKQLAFRELVESVSGIVTQMPKGSFKDSGTMVNTVIVILTKPLVTH